MFFCFQISFGQDQFICDSEFNFFGVDMDENNGNGSTNSTYEWRVLEDEFAGNIIPQTPSGNQIIIEWQTTPLGDYTVVVQEFNSEVSCLPDPQQMLVRVLNLSPEDILGPEVVCEGNSIALDHAFMETGEWSVENPNIGQISQDGIFEAFQEGHVFVNFNYEVNGCHFLVSKLIRVEAKPLPTLQGGELCIDADELEEVVLDSGLSQQDHDFQWYFNNELLPFSDTQITASNVGEYKLQVINLETGCVSDPITVEVRPAPTPVVSVNAFTDFNNSQRIVVNINTPENYLFRLENGEFQDSPIFHNVTTEGLHRIWIVEKEGCFSKQIDVILINYPRFFTPNDDGINDTWNITSLENDPTAQVFIFDRYGKLLKVISPRGRGWDGIYNSRRMPVDDYWFLVEYKDTSDGSDRTFRSHFTLKR